MDEAGTINVLSGVTGFSNSDAGSSDYVVQAGDTMQSIAQAVYGDANLWYVVADANGFDAAEDAPPAGQVLGRRAGPVKGGRPRKRTGSAL